MGENRKNRELKKNHDIPTNFVLGVRDTLNFKKSNDLIVVGPLKGTVRVGDAVYISNLGSDTEPISLSTIVSIEKMSKKSMTSCSSFVKFIIP